MIYFRDNNACFQEEAIVNGILSHCPVIDVQLRVDDLSH